MITGGVWVARKAFTNGNPETVQLFLKMWDQAQQDYKAKPAEVRQYEARRVNMTPADFDKLVEGQSVAHPTFADMLTADFIGPPGREASSRLGKHLQNIAAFLLAERRIQAVPADWAGLLNTKPIQAYIASTQ